MRFAGMGKITAAVWLFTLVSSWSGPAFAIKLQAADDYWLDVRMLVQPWIQFSHDPSVHADLNSDFYLRRTRLMFEGQVSKWVTFFVDTDQPNWGKGNDWRFVVDKDDRFESKNDFFVQDAFVTLDLFEEFKIDLGLLLVPFVRQTRQGATTLHTLDYHTAIVKYPANSNIVWRDAGVEFRGLLFNKKLDYRLMVANGLPTEDDIPRFSGRVAANIFDAEEKFFLGGTYLGKKKVLSIGLAFDTQPDAIKDANGGKHPYYAVGGDIFWDIPFGKNRLSGQADYVYYGGDDNATAGQGLAFDIGYAVGPFEPLVALDWFRPQDADEFKEQMLGAHVGFNWWFKEHIANMKFDYGLVKEVGREFKVHDNGLNHVFTLQTQVWL